MIADFQGTGPHYIPLRGEEMYVRIGDYVVGIRKAKANPDATFSHGLGGWWPETGREILLAFHRHIDTVINRKGGCVPPEATDRMHTLIRIGQHFARGRTHIALRELLPLPWRWRRRINLRRVELSP